MNPTNPFLMLTALAAASAATVETPNESKESLFDNVAAVLSERFVYEAFRENELPKIIERYRERAKKAETLKEHAEVVQQFLSNIPSTHLALIKSDTFEGMHCDLSGDSAPSFGFELIEYDGKQYAFNVLEKGPADRAGLRRGDRIVLIDGVLPEDSPRFGWRTDDAFLPDPPLRPVRGQEDDVMRLTIERVPGEYQELEIRCTPYSTWEAAKASARIVEQDGKRIGVVHFWLIHMTGPDEFLKELLEGKFSSCDALLLDLRGRGGNGFMVHRMLDVLDGTTSSWTKPVVALINRHSRSAKEVIASQFRKLGIGSLVGERTAGAVIPVTMADVGHGFSLMFPSFTMEGHTDQLEFKGVAPDVVVSEVGPYSAGADPIFEAGVKEAVRLANEPPEVLTALRAEAAKKFPKSKTRTEFAHRQLRMQRETPSETSSTEPDEPGYDAVALDIWAKMIRARGGEDILRGHKYLSIRGKRNMGGMMEGTFEELAAAPNKRVDRMTLGGMAEMASGYNGEVGWRRSPHEGLKMMDEEDLEEYRASADFFSDLDPKRNHTAVKYVGETNFNGKKCHEIRMTRSTGKVETHFIDSKTYLPAGWIGMVQSNIGPLKTTRVVDEYKTFDGEVVSVAFTSDVGGMQQMISTVTEVSFDPIPANVFDPPAELRAKD